MGKDSLIKSTSKKKAAPKQEDKKKPEKAETKSAQEKKKAAKTTKKTATKTTKKTAAQTTKKAAAKTTKKAATKTTPKAKQPAKRAPAVKAKAAAQKKASSKPAKKPSVKDLIFKKFEAPQPPPTALSVPQRPPAATSAPPFISSSDPDEVKRLRELLLKPYNMDAVRAAAKAPQPDMEPQAVAPEPMAPQPAASDTSAPSTATKVQPTEDNAYITMETTDHAVEPDPVTRSAKIAIAVAAAVVFLLLSISYNNSSKYYIYPKDNAIEIWKGRFSPKDNMFYMVLHGVELEAPPAAVYTSSEVFPLIFDYYLDKADTLLEVPGLPDFEGMKGYLNQAKQYVVNADMKAAVSSRLNNIERMILLYKAEVTMSKGTIDSLQSGIKLLKEADGLTATEIQSQEITQKIETARQQIAALKAASE